MTRYNKPNVMHVQNEVKVHKQKLKLSPKVHYQTLGQSCDFKHTRSIFIATQKQLSICKHRFLLMLVGQSSFMTTDILTSLFCHLNRKKVHIQCTCMF